MTALSFEGQITTRLHGISGIDGQIQGHQLDLGWIDQGEIALCLENARAAQRKPQPL
jgi:hypothetical protein